MSKERRDQVLRGIRLARDLNDLLRIMTGVIVSDDPRGGVERFVQDTLLYFHFSRMERSTNEDLEGHVKGNGDGEGAGGEAGNNRYDVCPLCRKMIWPDEDSSCGDGAKTLLVRFHKEDDDNPTFANIRICSDCYADNYRRCWLCDHYDAEDGKCRIVPLPPELICRDAYDWCSDWRQARALTVDDITAVKMLFGIEARDGRGVNEAEEENGGKDEQRFVWIP